MAQVKVSIILPVYNVEKYLRECMESLVNQTLSDIEIIAVNDGSPDNSIDILNEYKKNYPQKVTVYTTENKGVSHARNYGINYSQGEYILFVDSDDYIELDMCELLYKKAISEDNDLVLCNRYDVKSSADGIVERKIIDNLPLNQDFKLSDRKFELVKISPFPWDKLFKRSVFLNKRFEENLRFEDLLLVFSILPCVNSIGVVDAPLYNYRKTNAGGFLNSFSEATLDIVIVFERLIEEYKKQGIYRDYYNELEYLCIRHFFYRYENFFKRSKGSGKLDLKLKLIEDTIDFLEKQFPNWKENHYLKYSAKKELRENYDYYFSKKKMKKYIKVKQYMPASLMEYLDKKRKRIRKLRKYSWRDVCRKIKSYLRRKNGGGH